MCLEKKGTIFRTGISGSDKILVCLGEKGTGLGALLPLYGGAVNENHEGELFHLVAAQPASFNAVSALFQEIKALILYLVFIEPFASFEYHIRIQQPG